MKSIRCPSFVFLMGLFILGVSRRKFGIEQVEYAEKDTIFMTWCDLLIPLKLSIS